MHLIQRRVLSVSAVFALLLPVSQAVAQDKIAQGVAAEISRKGLARVIVMMKRPGPGEPPSLAAAEPLRYLGAALPAASRNYLKRIADLPAVVANIGPGGLAALRRDPKIAQVVIDEAVPATLAEVAATVNIRPVWKAGYNGANQVVVILDTGIDARHKFVQNQIVDEACFSTADPNFQLESLCPNGGEKQLGRGAAGKCIKGISCDHGTHVAGIIAGKGGQFKGRRFNGLAFGAKIIPIQVFTIIRDKENCAKSGAKAPCALTYYSDQLEALQYVYNTLSRKYNIASINMSLGGGKFPGTCDFKILQYTSVVSNLFAIGIPVVGAAGNSRFQNALNYPSCIGRVFSVGAAKKDGKVDERYSNASPNLDVFAIGTAVVSSVTGGGYKALNGTSMAAPEIAALVAVLKQAAPSASLLEILAALRSTGKKITDPRTKSEYTLVNAAAAIEKLGASTTSSAQQPPAKAPPPKPAKPDGMSADDINKMLIAQ